MARHDRQTAFDFELRSPLVTPAPARQSAPVPAPPAPPPTARKVALERSLTVLIEQRVALTITDNRHTMISARTEREAMQLRLHHMFLRADEATVRALAKYLTSKSRRAVRLLDEFIEANEHLIRRRRRTVRLNERGNHHPLGEIFDEVNRSWFADRVDCRVTWGRRPPGRRRRRSIRLGTYDATDRVIRIHPALDAPWVPRFFVAFVLYHEMLHHVVPAPVRNGRKRYHTAEFRRLERAHPDYERAVQWEKDNLARLLRS